MSKETAFPTSSFDRGMTLRDWFATHAPIVSDETIISDIPGYPTFDNSGYFNGWPAEDIRNRQRDQQIAWVRQARIKWRWLYADAMLAERAK